MKMDMIKIMTLAKIKFTEFYDAKQYKNHASTQLSVKKYYANDKKIIIDEK